MKSFTLVCSKQIKTFATLIIFSLFFSVSANAQYHFCNFNITNSTGNENNGNMVATGSSIKFNPGRIAQGILKVKMFNQPAGIYTVQLVDANGNVAGIKDINHTDGTAIEIADFGKNFTGGTYQIVVTSPDNKKTNETIMLLM